MVIGDTPLERFWLREAHGQFARFADRVSFEWLNDLSLDQMRRRVAALPAHSAVLYTLMITDAAGVPHEQEAALAALVEASAARISASMRVNWDAGSSVAHTILSNATGPWRRRRRSRALSGQTRAGRNTGDRL